MKKKLTLIGSKRFWNVTLSYLRLILLAVPLYEAYCSKCLLWLQFRDRCFRNNAGACSIKIPRSNSVHEILFIRTYANNWELGWIKSLEMVNIKIYLTIIYLFIWFVAENKGIRDKRVGHVCERRIWRSFLLSANMALIGPFDFGFGICVFNSNHTSHEEAVFAPFAF